MLVKMEKNSRSKLTFRDAQEIRHLYASKRFTQKTLADDYNISVGMVSHIIKYKTHKRDKYGI